MSTTTSTPSSISEYIVSGFSYFGISPPPSPPPPSPSISPSTPETTTTTINSNDKTTTTIVYQSNDKRIDCGDDDNNNATNKVISNNNYSKIELDKLVGMIHSSRCRKGDSCPYLGKECKIMQQTYVHSKNCKVSKNCKEPFCSRNLLRHFAECQNLDCRNCMHVRNVCTSSPMKKRGVCIETRK